MPYNDKGKSLSKRQLNIISCYKQCYKYKLLSIKCKRNVPKAPRNKYYI